jgi:FtsP/CotA-like multicopper oxidase with cupredoxin domain
MIEVEVTNGMTDEGTSMHWHGLLHKESQWYDGTPSIQQCPIAPGQTMTYRFLADQVGSSWWHSHLSAQYTSGAFGAMIIHGEGENTGYDEDLGPVFLSDWYHKPLPDSLITTMHSFNSQPPPADNLLINGKNNFPCETTTDPCVPNAGVSKFFFSPGKSYRLRLVNSGAAVSAKFSIDGHTFTVIAQDFTPVTPYQTDLISLANGQRVDVVVQATGEAGSAYWMRFDIGDGEVPNTCIGTLASSESSENCPSICY